MREITIEEDRYFAQFRGDLPTYEMAVRLTDPLIFDWTPMEGATLWSREITESEQELLKSTDDHANLP